MKNFPQPGLRSVRRRSRRSTGRWWLCALLAGTASSVLALSGLPFYDDFGYTDGSGLNGANGWEIYTTGPGYGSLPDEYHGWQGVPGGTATATNGNGRVGGVSLLRAFADYTGEPGTGWPTTSGEYDKAPVVTVRYEYEPDAGYVHTAAPTVWSKFGNMFSTKRWHYENRSSNYKMMTVVRYFVKSDGLISAYDGHRIQHLSHTPITSRVVITVTADYLNRTWSLWVGNDQVVSDFALFKTHQSASMLWDGWYKDYDGLKEVGFINASTNSYSDIDRVQVFEGRVGSRTLPFIETFETRSAGGETITMTPGNLNSQNNWFATGAAVATAAQSSAPDSAGVQGAEISGGGECFQLFLDQRTDVWTDLWLKPLDSGSGDTTVDAGGEDSVFRIDSAGNVYAYDEASASVVATVNPASWTRFTAHTDYNSSSWSLYINGSAVATGLAFRQTESGNAYQEFRVSASGTAVAHLDDVSISLVTPFQNPTVSFQTDTASVGENITEVTVTAVLSRPHGSVVTVDYVLQAGGSATLADDFNASDGTLVFAPGETSKSFTFMVINDSDNEEDETLIFSLVNKSNADWGDYQQITYTIETDPDDWQNIPFYEPFEERGVGDLDGQRGWTATHMDVQTTDKYIGGKAAKGVRLGSAHAHSFTNGALRVVTDWRAKPTFAQHPPTPPDDSTFALYVASNGHVFAYDGAAAVDMGAGVTLTPNQWVHFVVTTDHNTDTWDLQVNGTALATGLDFYSTNTSSYGEFGVIGPVTIDEVFIGYDTATAPTGVTAVALDAEVQLDWDPAQGALTYNISRATVSGGPYSVVGNTADTSFSDLSAVNDTTYYYVISAVNDRGEGDYSWEVSGTPRAAVYGVSVVSGIGFVDLTWEAFPAATGYFVRRATSAGGPYTTIATPAGTSYSDTAVANGTVYYYVIAAQTPAYVSTDSGEAVGTPNLRTIFYDSFEYPNVLYVLSIDIPGWKRTTQAGASDTRAGILDNASNTMYTPFGDQMAWIWSGRMLTTTGITEELQADATYTLTFNAAAEFGLGNIIYKVELLAGTTVIDSVTAAWPLDTYDHTYRYETIEFTVPGGHPAIGQPLGIRLRYESGDWHYEIGYDNVRLATNVEVPPILPNPMSFASPPVADSSVSAVMTATSVTNGVTPVAYLFENVDNGHSSGWISDTNWTDNALSPGVAYGYHVKARDVYANETAWSPVSYTTPIDTVGVPSVGLGIGPSSSQPDAATLRGELLSGGAALAVMCWGPSDAGTGSPDVWPNTATVGAVYSGETFSSVISGLTESTTYAYRAYVVNAAGEAWTAVTNFTTTGAANVMINDAGASRDSWNTVSNWTYGHAPTGTEIAVVSDGLVAEVNNAATPAYSGGLTLGQSATLQVGWTGTSSGNANALGTGTITLNSGSLIISRAGLGTYTFNQPFILNGDATIRSAISTANGNTTKTFAGGISGPGQLTYSGDNNTWFVFNTNNAAWTGGFQSADPDNDRHQVRAAANGAFGTGDVSINNNCSLQIDGGLSDTIGNGATLTLNGIASSSLAAKLVLNSNETVKHLWIDGIQQDAGVYTNTESWLSGPGELTVLEGAPVPTLIIFR